MSSPLFFYCLLLGIIQWTLISMKLSGGGLPWWIVLAPFWMLSLAALLCRLLMTLRRPS